MFNENTRVKIPATIHFLKLGYEFQSLYDAKIDSSTNIFVERFKNSLEKINKREISENDILKLISEIRILINNNDLGKSFYNRLFSSEFDIKLFDKDNYYNNNFAIVNELTFGENKNEHTNTFRPDITILVNGIPLSFLEVKIPNNDGGIQVEFDRMINKRLENNLFKKYFNLIQIVSFSNNMEYEEIDTNTIDEVKAGSFYSTPNGKNTNFSFFREEIENYYENYKYKNVDKELEIKIIKENYGNKNIVDSAEFETNKSHLTPCNKFITSFYDIDRFSYMLEYGIVFLTEIKKIKNETTNKVEELPIKQKHIMRYPQFFATRAILERMKKENKNGIVWHTQGSGKTALAAFSLNVIKDFFSKKNINTKFFFIVDRLDLMIQARTEFSNRGFNVIDVKDKNELALQMKSHIDEGNDGIGTICVVNIHKIIEESKMPNIKNYYNINTQRIFFVDEAHRSYKLHGEFFKNLMTCDKNGIYIALTGTPLLKKTERSNLKFGNYIHKYFYDKSIADGYTLKIKKEKIDTIAKADIKRNLQFENKKIKSKDVLESCDYVNCISKYIQDDFINFRYLHDDDTLGAMIVCASNNQAKKIHKWFQENSSLKTGIVLSDAQNSIEQNKLNKQYQIDFREKNDLDILIVHYMLTTGYDVKRLKKLYLLRGPKTQSLLQTISRVNRPYKNKSGKTYKYGYITDFVDIEKEYENTIESYRKELETEINDECDENVSLSKLLVDKDEIIEKYNNHINNIYKFIKLDNLEKFNDNLYSFEKDILLDLRKNLNVIKECSIEMKLSQIDNLPNAVDENKIKHFLKMVNNRISFLNLVNNTIETISVMNNDEIIEVIYEFIKSKITLLNLDYFNPNSDKFKKLKNNITEIQNEIIENKNSNDLEYKTLEESLISIFFNLNIDKYENIDDFLNDLSKIKEQKNKIDESNRLIAELYGGNLAFAKTYKQSISNFDVDDKSIEILLKNAYELLKDKINNVHSVSLSGEKSFIDFVKKEITISLLNEQIFDQIKDCYDSILKTLYHNLVIQK